MSTASPLKTVKITVELDDKHAWYLAQFLKRVSFATCERHSDPTDKEEPHYMIAALEGVRDSLAIAGYAPR